MENRTAETLLTLTAEQAKGATLENIRAMGAALDSASDALKQGKSDLWPLTAIAYAYPANREQVSQAAAVLNDKGRPVGVAVALGSKQAAKYWAVLQSARAAGLPAAAMRNEDGTYTVQGKSALEKATAAAVAVVEAAKAKEAARVAAEEAAAKEAQELEELRQIDPEAAAAEEKRREALKIQAAKEAADKAASEHEARLAAQNAADELTRIAQERDALRAELESLKAERVQIVAKLSEATMRAESLAHWKAAAEKVLTAAAAAKIQKALQA